jgi:uncharacterized membrane protein
VDGLLFALTLVAALGCGLSAGALFAFSSFVMRALAELQPPEGIRAMQSINVFAPTPVFMTALFGSGLLSLVLAVWGLLTLDEDYGAYLLAGGVLYLLGPVGVTMAFNVPRNNALAAADPESREDAELWVRYLAEWTRWNHVRVSIGLAATAMFTIALTVG